PVAPGSKLPFIGDSITAIYPEAANYRQVTHCYVTLFDALLRVSYPALKAQVISKGIGGQTVDHLSKRWEADVIQQRPDVLFVLIGINDADYLFRFKTQSPPEFERIYDELLTQTQRRLPKTRIVLMTPFMITRGKNIAGGGFNKD